MRQASFPGASANGVTTDSVIARICLRLDPHGPIRYKSARFLPEALGATLAVASTRQNRITSYNVCYTKLLRGATQPQALTEAVVTHGADLGIALDGDADRVVMCDERGLVVDGDQVLGLVSYNFV